MPKRYQCKESLPTIKALSFHLVIVHKVTCNKRLTCGEDSCASTFDSLKKFKAHFKKVNKFSDIFVSFERQGEVKVGKDNIGSNVHDSTCDTEQNESEVLFEPEPIDISSDLKSAVRSQAEAFTAKL